MNKYLIHLLLLLQALLVSACQKSIPGEEDGPRTVRLEISAAFDSGTKLNYTDNGTGGYSVSFRQEDRLVLYFRNAEGKATGDIVILPLLPSTLSSNGRKATFGTGNVTVPADAVSIFSYMDSSGEPRYMNYNATPYVELENQGGSLEEAFGRQIIAGEIALKDMQQHSAGYTGTIQYSYRTSILAFELTLPEPLDPKESPKIILSHPDNTFYNRIRMDWGQPFRVASRNKKGPIILQVVPDGKTVKAWACVWAGDEFNGSTFSLEAGGKKYIASINPEAPPEAGKMYRIRRTFEQSLERWTDDTAGSFPFDGGTAPADKEWLHYKNGEIWWTVNETGSPRKETLLFNGNSITVCQLEEQDFYGVYSLKSRTESNDNSFIGSLNPAIIDGIIFGPTRAGGVYPISIEGLYHTGTLTQAKVNIDYNAKTARFGLYLDGQTFRPALGGMKPDGSWGAPYEYAPTELGDPAYSWLWFSINEDFKTLEYTDGPAASLQRLGRGTYDGNDYIIGFSIITSGTRRITYLVTKNITFTKTSQYAGETGEGGITGGGYTEK